jgi:hypothetical protein
VDLRLPRIEYVQIQERDDIKGGRPDPAILRRLPAFFPNLRKGEFMGAPQEQEFIDALAASKRLEDLDVWFRKLSTSPVDPSALGQLSALRRLRLSGEDEPWNWAFLVRLERLEEVELGSQRQPAGGYGYGTKRLDQIAEPSYALTQLKWLRNVTLYENSAWGGQLDQIAKNNDLEAVRIPDWLPALTALETLQNETGLRKLAGLHVAGPRDQEIFAALKRMPQLRELDISFTSLSDDDLRSLAELKGLERITLEFDPHSGCVSDEGLAVFRKLPIAELRYRYSSGLPLASGMQQLVDNWSGPGPGMPFRQTDEGRDFLLRPPPGNR